METGIPDSKIYYALEELSGHHLIVVQRGNPSLYRPEDAHQVAENLRAEAKEEFDRRVRSIEDLARTVEPFLYAREDEGAIELAYIVKGTRNILSRMAREIEAAREEVLAIISSHELLEGLLPSLKTAQGRGVDVKLAVFGDKSSLRSLKFSEVKLSVCDCNILITDYRRLVTVSHHGDENAYAIISDDPNMIAMSRSYYESPTCCSVVGPSTVKSPRGAPSR